MSSKKAVTPKKRGECVKMFDLFPQNYLAPVMAEGRDPMSSHDIGTSNAESVIKTAPNTNNVIKSYLLRNTSNELCWYVDLDELQRFVRECLKLTGKWTSPGGDTKLFENKEIALKLYGPKAKETDCCW